MHPTRFHRCLGLSWLAVSLACFSPAAAQYSPQVGQPHPAFTLPALDDGRPVSLADFRGQKVLLVQFAAW